MGAAGVLAGNYIWSRNMGNADTQNGFLEATATSQGGSGDGGIQEYRRMLSIRREYSENCGFPFSRRSWQREERASPLIFQLSNRHNG